MPVDTDTRYDISPVTETDSAPFISIADALILGSGSGASGPDSIGAQYLYVSGSAAGSGYLAIEAGTITKITVKLQGPVAGTTVVRAVVYSETAGLPATLVCYSGTRSFTSADPEAEYDFTGLVGTPAITAAVRYWIGIYEVSQTAAGIRFPYAAGSSGITKYKNPVADPPPASFPASPSSDTEQLWAYLTYTVVAPGSGSYDLTPVTETDSVITLDVGIHRTPKIAAGGLVYLFGDSGNAHTLTPVSETDSAVTLTVLHGHYVTLGVASETDTARPLTLSTPSHHTLTPGTETDTAVALAITHVIVFPEAPLALSLPLSYRDADDLYGRVVVCDLPAGYWRLDDDDPEADVLGVNRLSPVGSPSSEVGLISTGQSRGLAGADAFTLTSIPDYFLGDTFSLECWLDADINPPGPGGGWGDDWGSSWGGGGLGGTGEWSLFSKGTNGYQVRATGSGLELWKEDEGLILDTTGFAFVEGETTHIVVTKDGPSAHIYVNGEDVSGTFTDRTIANTSTDLNIGRKSDGTEYATCTLDELAVYPYPLTQDMVRMHYLAGSGEFGRNHFDSPKYPAMAVEIAFDTAWNDPYPRWETVTDDLRATGVSIDGSGRPDETQRSSPAAAQLTLDNRARDFDPTYDAGVYGDRILPMLQIRIRFAWDTLYWGFKGWIDEWTVNELSFGYDTTTSIHCVDMFAAHANFEFDAANTLFPEQLAGARIEACLDLLGIPGNMRNIDAGISMMPQLERPDGKVLDHMLAVAESDGGFLYVGPDGRLVYEQRTARVDMPILGIFGDADGEYPYSGIERSSDTAYLFNRAVVTPGDGNEAALAEDAGSLAQYPPLTYTKSVLTGFNEAQAAAEWYVARYKDPAVRFLSIDVNGGSDPDLLWPVILRTVNSMRYRIRRRPLGGGTMELDEYVERVAHRITTAGWIVSLSLSPFGDEDLWPLDDPDFLLGSNTYPTW